MESTRFYFPETVKILFKIARIHSIMQIYKKHKTTKNLLFFILLTLHYSGIHIYVH